MFLLYNLQSLQPISILAVYGILGEGGRKGYNVKTIQPIVIVASYGTLEGDNITLLQSIVTSTAYSTLGTFQHKASTTNSHASSLEHSWGDVARSHYNQYFFSNVFKTLG